MRQNDLAELEFQCLDEESGEGSIAPEYVTLDKVGVLTILDGGSVEDGITKPKVAVPGPYSSSRAVKPSPVPCAVRDVQPSRIDCHRPSSEELSHQRPAYSRNDGTSSHFARNTPVPVHSS